MKKHYIFFLLFVLTVLLSSCLSTRKHYSAELHFGDFNLNALNGKYVMDRKNLYYFFNIRATDFDSEYIGKYYGAYETTGSILELVCVNERLSKDSVDNEFIILDFNTKDTLNIIYRDSSFWYKTSYKGKLKNKYFEISLQNKRYPFFPIVSRHDVDRIRVGVNQSGKVVVHNYSEHWGTFLLFGAHSGGDEIAFLLEKIE
jgi:hypothetical protein